MRLLYINMILYILKNDGIMIQIQMSEFDKINKKHFFDQERKPTMD